MVEGTQTPAWAALRHQLGMWYIFGLLAFFVIALVRRYPVRRGNLLTRIPVYMAASVIYSALHTAMFYLPTVALSFFWSEEFRLLAVRYYPFNSFVFLCTIAMNYGAEYYRRAQNRKLRAAQLEARLVESRLQILKMQIQPHFLFNTLHSIAALMYEDVDASHEMLTRLSDLLRETMKSAHKQEVTLAQELSFLEHYVEIQKMRFGDRLTFTMDIEPETRQAMVPNLILQPFVENSIQHGIAIHERHGKIELSAKLQEHKLRIEIRDNGPGLSRRVDAPASAGLGLSNSRKRLEQLYNGNHLLELTDADNGGLVIRLEIPYKKTDE